MTQGRNDSWQKRLALLGQIDVPSGDKADQAEVTHGRRFTNFSASSRFGN